MLLDLTEKSTSQQTFAKVPDEKKDVSQELGSLQVALSSLPQHLDGPYHQRLFQDEKLLEPVITERQCVSCSGILRSLAVSQERNKWREVSRLLVTWDDPWLPSEQNDSFESDGESAFPRKFSKWFDRSFAYTFSGNAGTSAGQTIQRGQY